MAHPALVVDDVEAALARLRGFGRRPQGLPDTIPTVPRAGTLATYAGSPVETIELLRLPG